MKKILSILLIAVYIANAGGIIFLFVIRKNQFNNEFRNFLKYNLKDHELKKIAIPLRGLPDNIFRMIESDEFRYMGKMYDIVREKAVGDSVFYYCYCDENEENFLQKFSDLPGAASSDKNPLKKMINEVIKLFPFGFLKTHIHINFYDLTLFLTSFRKYNQLNIFSDVASPPPKF